MAARPTRAAEPHADAPLERWRRALLLRAGFPGPLAEAAAADERMDVHALIELVDRGCPPELAVRILAPIDGRER